ncbi:MAG: hypothetical protein EBU62_07525, partial [Proteobacteria bacterium]|nr:hypothetical protein [Pseudomonadota bacterium]
RDATLSTVWGHVHRDGGSLVIVNSVTIFIPPAVGRGNRHGSLQRTCNPQPVSISWGDDLDDGRMRCSFRLVR